MRTTDRLRQFLVAFSAAFVLACIQPQSARSADPPLIILTDSAAEHLLGTDLQVLRDRLSPGCFSLEKIGSTTIRGRVQPVDVWAARDFGDTTT